MSRRKETPGVLRPMLSSGRGGEDSVRAYLKTSKGSLNKRLPANILYKTHPRDQISTLLVFGFDVSCTSGAMYPSVPVVVFRYVEALESGMCFEVPKSPILTRRTWV